jgi:hypothetical protein
LAARLLKAASGGGRNRLRKASSRVLILAATAARTKVIGYRQIRSLLTIRSVESITAENQN